jgi:hypothetical protein
VPQLNSTGSSHGSEGEGDPKCAVDGEGPHVNQTAWLITSAGKRYPA